MTFKHTFISIIAIALVGYATWLTLSFYRPQTFTVIKQVAIPDAFMEDVTALIMDKDGRLRMKIVTPKMVHFNEKDVTKLTTPQLTLYRKSPVPWRITSKHAQARDGVENVDFWDEVLIQHAADLTAPATLIKTESLTVHPNQQTAETNALITLIQPSITVNATGMFADMNAGSIKLLSQARGVYVPTP